VLATRLPIPIDFFSSNFSRSGDQILDRVLMHGCGQGHSTDELRRMDEVQLGWIVLVRTFEDLTQRILVLYSPLDPWETPLP
jgi:hypothetical protein